MSKNREEALTQHAEKVANPRDGMYLLFDDDDIRASAGDVNWENENPTHKTIYAAGKAHRVEMSAQERVDARSANLLINDFKEGRAERVMSHRSKYQRDVFQNDQAHQKSAGGGDGVSDVIYPTAKSVSEKDYGCLINTVIFIIILSVVMTMAANGL